jgi:DNA-directed RNA polymerase subunit beta'
LVYGKDGELIRSYNLPVGALMVENGEKIKAGKVLVKIPRRSSKSGDITGGLPRITELLELVILQTQQFQKSMVLFLLEKSKR